MIETVLRRLRRGLFVVLPALAAVMLYGAQALTHEFVSLDDGLLITGNPVSQELSPRSVAYAFTHYDPELYIPLTFLSYQIDSTIWGLNPVGFHLTNLFLHALGAVLVTLLVLKISGSRFAALVVGLLFAIHPLNTEAVLWAAARKDVLSACLALGSAIAFLHYREASSKTAYRFAVALFLCALLAKVSVAVLPLLIVLHDWVKRRPLDRRLARELAPFLTLSVVFIIIAIVGKSANLQSSGPLTTLLLALKSAAFYLLKLVWPTGLTAIYPQIAPVTIASTEFAMPAIVVVVALAAAFLLRNRLRSVSALILAYGVLLLPNSTNYLKNDMLFFASDRYAYIAGLAVFGLVAYALVVADRRLSNAKSASLALAMLIIAVLGGATGVAATQSRSWRNSEALYRRTLDVYSSALAWNNLGDILMKAGKRDEAKQAFDRAIEIDPTLMAAHLNRGDALRTEGKLDAALEEMRTAVAIVEAKTVKNLEELGAYYYLGQTLEDMGRIPDMLDAFKTATEKLPDAAEPHYNYGILLQKYDKKSEAYGELKRATELEPLMIEAWYHLAALQAGAGMLAEAEASLRTVLKLNPAHQKAREHLDAILRLKS